MFIEGSNKASVQRKRYEEQSPNAFFSLQGRVQRPVPCGIPDSRALKEFAPASITHTNVERKVKLTNCVQKQTLAAQEM